MHFWIDKRSPQCGFGRSRVAASLHTGGSGLSFGHPPRRSGGHKSSSSSSGGNTSLSASSNAGIQVHRQQQQQQQVAAAQYHTQHAATTSNNAPYRTSTQYATGSSSNNTTSNNNNNSNTAANQATNRNFVRSNVSANHHHYYNNNRQQTAHHHHQQQQQSSSCVLPNSSNNNLTSPTGNSLNTSLNNAATTATTTITTGAQQQQQHAQRYRHPQFGNMSVRTYQPTMQQQQQQPTTTTTPALTSHPQQQLQIQVQQSTTTNISNATNTTTTTNNTLNHHIMATTTAAAAATTNQLQQSLDASLNTLNEHGIHQSPNQTANLSAELYHQTSPRIVTSFNRPLTAATMTSGGICDYSSVSANPRTTYTNSALQTTTTNLQLHHHQHSSRQRRNTRSIESTDLQFLPLHLKCGIFASLVLAIAFIVGIKVYFDNHGTKFEVGLFWLLTATFVFAFCFVSICKVPRVLFASTTSSRSNSRDQTRGDRCSMDDAVARGSMVNSIDDVVITGLHEFQQEQIQSININAQAGPPPYHIAILLPETKAKEDISTLEESPPPSYDKILI
ncbi:homeobox protein 13 [Lucilia sericata]|uniref:homeobox protein 13 n=1 Tax=Lucilia sericata TaxID=13632 RepID=UPI0018A86F7B|nr:homeobox protein 13 [Lucilia sericata]